jgi:hypothetical protein
VASLIPVPFQSHHLEQVYVLPVLTRAL